jgi:hypothetical protein
MIEIKYRHADVVMNTLLGMQVAKRNCPLMDYLLLFFTEKVKFSFINFNDLKEENQSAGIS